MKNWYNTHQIDAPRSLNAAPAFPVHHLIGSIITPLRHHSSAANKLKHQNQHKITTTTKGNNKAITPPAPSSS